MNENNQTSDNGSEEVIPPSTGSGMKGKHTLGSALHSMAASGKALQDNRKSLPSLSRAERTRILGNNVPPSTGTRQQKRAIRQGLTMIPSKTNGYPLVARTK